ncbi:thioredoxin family protein [Ponticoccus sp. SC2-23]|uniref:thioredoxin family protein n=1 Tax=Alexandriicola marinus TaxID=2081710 RepID=UPI000FD9A0BC|nr:thioredoxin family protein [Alexandriicola marinus]MBM1220229.1 thioredoxin family protein [Ponticoccus sp. SC6-9]MBM1224915.1 thioredoxin family protein [Ponticoccus sp. SC6-15]MBM1228429.1 thioredoxin family protein [Ponticoccus sp. SC6-38]MBM1233934.1 thioredoxin family protein [Ponticoccus sp. SC6-45]MBM1238930.1 thioredoxin family protein [Ponticoccus sp. SC6-49]MBM1242712.1 thioredoxin family protein [Ponticoccus sp. SC2-64]MBM1247458.1 thioredoxin family protein [Ponticoccus sp. SC
MIRTVLFSILTACWAVTAGATELGDDGLHKPDWLRETFLDLREDLAEAESQGLRMMVIIEQRGCIYCTRMHEEVFPDPAIDAYIRENFFVVQLNMFGDLEVTDFDGEVMAEKDIVRRWGALFTPTIMFFPHEVDQGLTAAEASVATMPGAFEKGTTLSLLTWVNEELYLTDEPFQKYLARVLAERTASD